MGMLATVKNPVPRAIGHYSAEEAARLVGVSPRRLTRWASYGIVPSVRQNPSVYSYADVGEAILAHFLVNLGWRPKQIAGLVRRLRERWGPWPLTNAPLGHDGKLIVLREDDDVSLDAIDRVDHLLIHETLNLEAIRRALRTGGWVSLPAPREHIEVDPDIHSGQPVLTGHRIPTAMVAEVADEQGGRDILRDDYGLTDDEIDAAIEYEEAVSTVLAA
jgi:uncharacterized protein (DUF433 family)/DNA-binding transcriptional MerR regulator